MFAFDTCPTNILISQNNLLLCCWQNVPNNIRRLTMRGKKPIELSSSFDAQFSHKTEYVTYIRILANGHWKGDDNNKNNTDEIQPFIPHTLSIYQEINDVTTMTSVIRWRQRGCALVIFFLHRFVFQTGQSINTHQDRKKEREHVR